MKVPDINDLNQMAQAIAGTDYLKQPPEHRVTIMKLTLQCQQVESLDELWKLLEDGFNRMEKLGTETNTMLSNIDVDLEPITDWFKHSKLWEGRLS